MRDLRQRGKEKCLLIETPRPTTAGKLPEIASTVWPPAPVVVPNVVGGFVNENTRSSSSSTARRSTFVCARRSAWTFSAFFSSNDFASAVELLDAGADGEVVEELVLGVESELESPPMIWIGIEGAALTSAVARRSAFTSVEKENIAINVWNEYGNIRPAFMKKNPEEKMSGGTKP